MLVVNREPGSCCVLQDERQTDWQCNGNGDRRGVSSVGDWRSLTKRCKTLTRVLKVEGERPRARLGDESSRENPILTTPPSASRALRERSLLSAKERKKIAKEMFKKEKKKKSCWLEWNGINKINCFPWRMEPFGQELATGSDGHWTVFVFFPFVFGSTWKIKIKQNKQQQ